MRFALWRVSAMKRVLKLVGLLVVLLLAVGIALFAPVFMGRRSAGEGAVGSIRLVRDGFVTVAVIPIAPQEVALVDAGNDAEAAAIMTDLKRSGLGPEAVKTILITHGHPDHIAGVAAFPQAQVLALSGEVPLIEGRVAAGGPLPRLFGARPTNIKVARALADGDTVALGETTIRVYAVPGHTAGSAAYLVDDVLFLGDAADAGRDGAVKGAPWIFSDSQEQDRESLVRLAQRLEQDQRAVSSIVFAHSGVLTEGLEPLRTFAQNNSPNP
jgi:glyoxylase-like metal-dependent hydrolase (beta-lactamase superfamily II)